MFDDGTANRRMKVQPIVPRNTEYPVRGRWGTLLLNLEEEKMNTLTATETFGVLCVACSAVARLKNGSCLLFSTEMLVSDYHLVVYAIKYSRLT